MGIFDFLWGKREEKRETGDTSAYAAPVVFPAHSDDETNSSAPDSSGGFDGGGASSGGDGGGV